MSEPLRSSAGRLAGLGRLIGGVAILLLSAGMLLGSFALIKLDALGVRPTPTQEVAFWPSFTPSPSATIPPLPSSPSPSPSPPATETPGATEVTVTHTPTSVPSPTPTPPDSLIPTCTHPLGWIVYNVQRGDTLASLARRTGTSAYALMQANCLSTVTIYVGQRIYLPPTYYASPTPRPYTCGPPLGWTVYYVQKGDTLYGLSRRFGVGIDAIRRANCLSTYTIYIGQPLYLPRQLYTPTPIPTPLPTATSTPTLTPTLTPSPELSPTPTSSVVPTPTYTPTPTETITSTLTPTFTPTPTEGTPPPTFTPTPTSTSTPTPTQTEAPATSTPTPTPTSTPES